MSQLNVNTLNNAADSGSDISVSNLGSSQCRAWASFTITAGTPAIDDEFNVSSITDDGNGLYTVNFTSNMNDADYCVVGTSKPTSSYLNNIMLRWNVAQTTSAFALFAGSYNTIPADCLEAHVAVFGS